MPSELQADVSCRDPHGNLHAMNKWEGQPGELVSTLCGQRCDDWPVVLGEYVTCTPCALLITVGA